MTKLTSSQLIALKDHLTSDPNNKGYAVDITSGNIGYITDKLNALTQQKTRLRKINMLEIMKECWAESLGIITKLRAAASADVRVDEAVIFLRSVGLDINDPITQGMFGSIGFTPTEVAALTAMAQQPCSEMDILNLPQATDEMVWEALGA